MTDEHDKLCDGQHADAPFCRGPSDPEGRGFDGVSLLSGCGPDGQYVEVATGVGTFDLYLDGDRESDDLHDTPEYVTTWTVTPDDLSDAGVHTVSFPAPDAEYMSVNRDGVQANSGNLDGCGNGIDEPTTTTETSEPAPPPVDQLPHTGTEANLLVVGLLLVAAGTAILRKVGNR